MEDKRRTKAPNSPARDALRLRADKLVQETGIPRALAFQVAAGTVQLNDALQRLAMQDRIEGLMRQHNLPRSLAAQIALGQASLDTALFRRRMQEYLAEHKTDSVLLRAAETGERVSLGVLGRRWINGVVLSVGKYEFDFQGAEGEPVRMHKLQVKVGAWARDLAKVRSQVRTDKTLDRDAEPIWRPKDRYGCSDRRLFGYFDAQTRIVAATTEGDVVKGTVDWVGRWEFGVKLARGVKVVVFRHALADMGEE